MLKWFLRDDVEADQSNIGPLESEDSDTGGVDIEGYLPEIVLSMNKLDLSSNISDGDSEASKGRAWASFKGPRPGSRDTHSIIR